MIQIQDGAQAVATTGDYEPHAGYVHYYTTAPGVEKPNKIGLAEAQAPVSLYESERTTGLVRSIKIRKAKP